MTDAPLEKYGPLDNITPEYAANVMARIQSIRHDAVREYRRLAAEAARLKKEAAKAKARALLQASGPMEERKARAALESADEVFDAEVAAALVESQEKAMYVLKDDWDTCRTIASNERAKKNALEGFGA